MDEVLVRGKCFHVTRIWYLDDGKSIPCYFCHAPTNKVYSLETAQSPLSLYWSCQGCVGEKQLLLFERESHDV